MTPRGASSRRARLIRLELADQITQFLAGGMDGNALIDWALDHPFYEDRSDLSSDDEQIVGAALGQILTMGPREPLFRRTTREQLAETVRALSNV